MSWLNLMIRLPYADCLRKLTLVLCRTCREEPGHAYERQKFRELLQRKQNLQVEIMLIYEHKDGMQEED